MIEGHMRSLQEPVNETDNGLKATNGRPRLIACQINDRS